MNGAYALLVVGLLVGAALGFGVIQLTRESGFGAASAGKAEPFGIGAAGTLQFAFNQILSQVFMKTFPGIQVAPPYFKGSGAVAQEELATKQFSIEAAADTTTMPSVLFPANVTDYEIAFGITSMAIIVNMNSQIGREAYTLWRQGQSYAPLSSQSNQTWARIFNLIAFNSSSKVGVSNPFTDPSGYQAICMTKLAGETFFGNQTRLYNAIYNDPSRVIQRDTETDLLPLMATGNVDFIISSYLSNAIPQTKQYPGTAYLTLPPDISLGNLSYVNFYHAVKFSLSQQGVTKSVTCNPVVYTITIPRASPNPVAAALFIETLFSVPGEQILRSHGITPLTPAPVFGNFSAVPDSVKPFCTAATGAMASIFPS